MIEQLISFETAKLAKEKKFNIETYGKCWIKTLDGRIIHNSERKNIPEDDRHTTFLMQPTQSLLQRWLRETHKIFVSVDFIVENTNGMAYIKYDNEPIKYTLTVEYITKSNIWDYLEHDFDDFETYEEALEKGLYEALKHIK